jgi:hypothetical protein
MKACRSLRAYGVNASSEPASFRPKHRTIEFWKNDTPEGMVFRLSTHALSSESSSSERSLISARDPYSMRRSPGGYQIFARHGKRRELMMAIQIRIEVAILRCTLFEAPAHSSIVVTLYIIHIYCYNGVGVLLLVTANAAHYHFRDELGDNGSWFLLVRESAGDDMEGDDAGSVPCKMPPPDTVAGLARLFPIMLDDGMICCCDRR